jgi:hypothetical protein
VPASNGATVGVIESKNGGKSLDYVENGDVINVAIPMATAASASDNIVVVGGFLGCWSNLAALGRHTRGHHTGRQVSIWLRIVLGHWCISQQACCCGVGISEHQLFRHRGVKRDTLKVRSSQSHCSCKNILEWLINMLSMMNE